MSMFLYERFHEWIGEGLFENVFVKDIKSVFVKDFANAYAHKVPIMSRYYTKKGNDCLYD